jgi:hypothetical protein
MPADVIAALDDIEFPQMKERLEAELAGVFACSPHFLLDHHVSSLSCGSATITSRK